MLGAAGCRTMARYNRWMNKRLYAVCAALPDETRKSDRGAPFHSIHGTLNHLLLADRLWMGRFRGAPYAIRGLDQDLYADFEELRAARAASDAEILAWADSLTDEELAQDFTFVSFVDPKPRTMPLWFAAQHFFNHQTHHRGQLTTLLEQEGCDYGVTDLMWLPDGPPPADR